MSETEHDEPPSTEPESTEGSSPSGVPLEELLGAVEARIEADNAGALRPEAPARRSAALGLTGRSVIFELGQTRCALPIDRVVEIGEVPKITPVPNVPSWLAGVANLRGDIMAVIDLRALIGQPPFDRERRQGRLLVVRSSPGPKGEVAAGLWVDSVLGVSLLARAELAPPGGPIEDALAVLLEGVLVHEGRLLAAVDLDLLFAHPELRRLRAEGAPIEAAADGTMR